MRSDQQAVAERLGRRFGPELVRTEWTVIEDRGICYSPRLDVAVGPFAASHENTLAYESLIREHWDFLAALRRLHVENAATFGSEYQLPDLATMSHCNRRAHCLLAVEVEASGTRKHVLGGMVNACAVGRFGIALACDSHRLDILLRLREYMMVLTEGATRFDTRNSLVLTIEQFNLACDEHLGGA